MLNFTIVDIQGRIVRDHGIIPGMTNDAPWTKRLIHVIDSTYQCRIILWKDHVRKIIIITNKCFKFISIFFLILFTLRYSFFNYSIILNKKNCFLIIGTHI